MTAYGPDPIGSYLAQVDDLDAEEETHQARQDAYEDLRAQCQIYDLIYHVTDGQPVPAQPVTHTRERKRP